MKGVIHIFEIVIVALVMFITLMQLSYIPRMETDWPRTKLFMSGWDIIFTLDEKGINWMDPAEVGSGIEGMLNRTNTRFNVMIKGAPPANISVGCICTPQEFNTLRDILTGFSLNGEDIRFSVTRIDPSEIAFFHRNDVTFVWDYSLGAHRIAALNYLEAGKGIVEVRDLDQGDIDSVQSDVFGLSWNASLVPGSSNITFNSPLGADESRLIEKYFHSIPGSGGQTYPESHEFLNFLSGERVWQKDSDPERMVLVQESSGVPACIINSGMSGGKGRTAWLSGTGSLEEDEKVLIKSLVLWAAGDEYEVVEGDIKTSIAKFSFYKVLDQDMYQPLEIILSMGYLY